jgi:hypothetical protein
MGGNDQMKSLLLTSTMLIALVSTGAAFAADNTGDTPGGTGIEQSTEFMGATNKQGDTSAPGQMKTGANSTDRHLGSAEGKGATDKSTEDPTAPIGSKN